MEAVGTIYNIQPYSIHDGPGIRTVVFLKGCPLSCIWCSNPESQEPLPQTYYSPVRCIACGLCVQACPRDALSLMERRVRVDRERCIACGACHSACPTEAICISGRTVTPEALVEEVEKDRHYLMKSGGGITFSGGEPFLQSDFLHAAVRRLKQRGYHIAVETCGYAPLAEILPCIAHVDLLLYDVKLLDPGAHRRCTGRDNRMILENLYRLYGMTDLIFRIPTIPGVNDTESEMGEIAAMIAAIDPSAVVHLLPYHSLGKAKYQNIGREYPMEDLMPPEACRMAELQSLFTNRGLECEIL